MYQRKQAFRAVMVAQRAVSIATHHQPWIIAAKVAFSDSNHQMLWAEGLLVFLFVCVGGFFPWLLWVQNQKSDVLFESVGLCKRKSLKSLMLPAECLKGEIIVLSWGENMVWSPPDANYNSCITHSAGNWGTIGQCSRLQLSWTMSFDCRIAERWKTESKDSRK